jgi:hypothetical protein
VIRLSEVAANPMLDTLARLMDGGTIELMADGALVAVFNLSNPCAGPALGGELEFNDIAEEDAAVSQGTATMARIRGANGREVFSCDVGDLNSDAVVKLNTTKIYKGGPVRLTSFRLVMP